MRRTKEWVFFWKRAERNQREVERPERETEKDGGGGLGCKSASERATLTVRNRRSQLFWKRQEQFPFFLFFSNLPQQKENQ